jgi:hypothetical protein
MFLLVNAPPPLIRARDIRILSFLHPRAGGPAVDSRLNEGA